MRYFQFYTFCIITQEPQGLQMYKADVLKYNTLITSSSSFSVHRGAPFDQLEIAYFAV